MGQTVATYPDLPQFTQTLTLDEVQYRLRLTWRPRQRAWYADLWLLDGTAVALGRRVSPKWGLLLGLLPAGAPAGTLYVRGSDPYERDMLGDSLAIVYYTAAEVGEAPADPALQVTV